jgi:hypothetical protein
VVLLCVLIAVTVVSAGEGKEMKVKLGWRRGRKWVKVAFAYVLEIRWRSGILDICH